MLSRRTRWLIACLLILVGSLDLDSVLAAASSASGHRRQTKTTNGKATRTRGENVSGKPKRAAITRAQFLNALEVAFQRPRSAFVIDHFGAAPKTSSAAQQTRSHHDGAIVDDTQRIVKLGRRALKVAERFAAEHHGELIALPFTHGYLVSAPAPPTATQRRRSSASSLAASPPPSARRVRLPVGLLLPITLAGARANAALPPSSTLSRAERAAFEASVKRLAEVLAALSPDNEAAAAAGDLLVYPLALVNTNVSATALAAWSQRRVGDERFWPAVLAAVGGVAMSAVSTAVCAVVGRAVDIVFSAVGIGGQQQQPEAPPPPPPEPEPQPIEALPTPPPSEATVSANDSAFDAWNASLNAWDASGGASTPPTSPPQPTPGDTNPQQAVNQEEDEEEQEESAIEETDGSVEEAEVKKSDEKEEAEESAVDDGTNAEEKNKKRKTKKKNLKRKENKKKMTNTDILAAADADTKAKEEKTNLRTKKKKTNKDDLAATLESLKAEIERLKTQLAERKT